MVGLKTPSDVVSHLTSLADEAQASKSMRFFKTAQGEYGHGDMFLGIRMPVLRQLVPLAELLSVEDTFELLANKYHEIRLFALLLLVKQFKTATEQQRGYIIQRYINATEFINNWDLVDASAYHLLGPYLIDKETKILETMAKSHCMWQRRIAIVSTYHFIKQARLSPTYKIAQLLFYDTEDLIHKAVGWMLKEAGKRDEERLVDFLMQHRQEMPKTMLRFAMEKLPKEIKTQLRNRH